MKLVILELPYAGDIEQNETYARACMRDCLTHGEAPYASHLLYTQPGVLRDNIPGERELGIQAGFRWRHVAELTVVYTDLGLSNSMQQGIAHAEAIGCPIEYRTLRDWGKKEHRATCALNDCKAADCPEHGWK